MREGGGVSLTVDARKAVVVAFQERKQEEVRHPVLAQALPLGLVPLVQARLSAGLGSGFRPSINFSRGKHCEHLPK